MAAEADKRRAIDLVCQLLSSCRSVLFITGAGISADSGLPTYRGVGGLYDVDDTEDGLPIEELLSGEMMRCRPELTWKYLAQIGHACRGATFNRGHEVIAEMERHFDRVWTLTQNVDGFHRQAGSHNVIDIHGDLHELVCTACNFRDAIVDMDEVPIPPRCLDCQAIIRPNVVLFGELLPLDKVNRLRRELKIGFDIVIAIGTTAYFPYISEPVRTQKLCGKPTVEINPGESELSHVVDIKLTMRAAEALDAIWRQYIQACRDVSRPPCD